MLFQILAQGSPIYMNSTVNEFPVLRDPTVFSCHFCPCMIITVLSTGLNHRGCIPA
jgi:hypothetical protein